MGSFLSKCFVSQQSIVTDCPCVIMPLIQFPGKKTFLKKNNSQTEVQNHKSISGVKLINEFLGLKFDGTSSDCGVLILKNSILNRESLLLFFDILLKNAYDSEEKKDTFSISDILQSCPRILGYLVLESEERIGFDVNSIPWKEFVFTWEKIQEADRESLIFINTIHSHNHPLLIRLSACLKFTYDYMVKSQGKFTEIAHLKQVDKESIDKVLKSNEMLKKFPMTAPHEFSLNENFWYKSEYTPYQSKVFLENNNYSKKLSAENILKSLNKLRPIVKFLQFQKAIYELNITPLPVQYAGQDYANENGDKYLKMVYLSNKYNKEFIRKKYK